MKTIIAFALSVTLLAACHSGSNFEQSAPGDADKTGSLDISASTEEIAGNESQDEKSANYGLVEDLKTDGIFSRVNQSPFKSAEMIIRTSNINMRVTDYKKSRAEFEKLILSQGAYIANENEQKTTYSMNNTIVIRVSNKQFSQLSSDIALLGAEVNSRNMTSEDVTGEFVDISSRLKTKKEVEARYIELLKRATTITDILNIENNIRVIREEIEAKEGQLKFLSDQVSWSTINLSVYQTYEGGVAYEEEGFFSKLASSLGMGWKGLLDVILGFLQVWPLWLFLTALGWGTYRIIKRFSTKLRKDVPHQTPSVQS